jgi:hypothetical protein
MSIENNSSPEEDQEITELSQSTSEPGKCQHDGDCPSGQRCVDGNCV